MRLYIYTVHALISAVLLGVHMAANPKVLLMG